MAMRIIYGASQGEMSTQQSAFSQKNKNIKRVLLFEEWFYKMFYQRGGISYLNSFRLKKEIIFILTQGEEYHDKQLK